jgi:hypothetical protein
MGVLAVRNYGRSFLLSLLSLLLAGPALAASLPADADSWCGTTPNGFAVSAAIHRDHQLRLERHRAEEKALQTFPEAVKAGDVAVLVDDGSIVVQPNRQDLANFGVQFVPQKKGGYVVSPSGDGVSEDIGERVSLGDDDAQPIKFPKGFKFRFYGKAQKKLFVHSDGNLTFGAPDAASTARDLSRLLGGPARIAPFFADLNPETASGDGGVWVLASKAKIVVTWLDVPGFGETNSNTFQAVLYANGRITFAFGGLAEQEAVVGLAPGGGGQAQLVDYTAGLPIAVGKAAIAERFVATKFLDDLAIAQAFFREFADSYDHLVVFLDFVQALGGGEAFAYEFTVKNEILGIGNGVYDGSAEAGSKARLRSFVEMGTLANYPDDPEVEFLRTNSTLDLLGHETGHRWLATLHFLDGNGQPSNALLGRQLAHWSFCHNSLASEMEGNLIRDDGGGRFTTIGATDGYSPLDLYAMGLIGPTDVPPFFYVDQCRNAAAAPEIGIGLLGNRVDLTIDDVIAAEGPRVPPAKKAPHSFTMAFILVAPPGQFPSEEEIAKVDRFRAAWEPYFAQITNGLGSVDTTLKLRRGRGHRRQ